MTTDLKKLAEALDDEEDSCRSCGISFVSTTFARTLLRECTTLQQEVEAYKRAKQENDDRFMLERDEARQEVETLREQNAKLRRLADVRKVLMEEYTHRAARARQETLRDAVDHFVLQNRVMFTIDEIAHELRALQHTGEDGETKP